MEDGKRRDPPDGEGPASPGPPSSPDPIVERLARLEGAFDWIKVSVSVIAAALFAGVAFVGVQITRVDARVSALSDKVDALPDKVNASIRELTSTLAQAILASKQAAPTVIVLPASQAPGPQPTPPP